MIDKLLKIGEFSSRMTTQKQYTNAIEILVCFTLKQTVTLMNEYGAQNVADTVFVKKILYRTKHYISMFSVQNLRFTDIQI